MLSSDTIPHEFDTLEEKKKGRNRGRRGVREGGRGRKREDERERGGEREEEGEKERG